MLNAISLHIGVWKPTGYVGFPELSSPKAEPYALAAMAHHHGFEQCTVLSGRNATWPAVQQKIREAGRNLEEAGLFLITFCGHGTKSADGRIQTWCLDDRKVPDEDLFAVLGQEFTDSQKIVIYSASCFSGGVSGMLHRVVRMLADAFNGLFDGARERPSPATPGEGPSVLVLAACRAGEKARDDTPLSLFTGAVWEVWQNGTFRGTYKQFMDAVTLIVNQANDEQMPKLTPQGSPHDWNDELLFELPSLASIIHDHVI